jgi:lipoprotein-anchoring transpeptidase ErfK/SrfK
MSAGDDQTQHANNTPLIRIALAEQRLEWRSNTADRHQILISSARRGAGEQYGSGCTPRGLHRVRLAIGANCPLGTVFQARRPTGEYYSQALASQYPNRDWILTRILWLTGLESGINRGGAVDTLRRFIYIHGCPDTEPLGIPCSHGCIRLHQLELIDLFSKTPNGTLVEIRDAFFDDPVWQYS